MNFDFSDEQKLLREQARKFLTEKCTTRAVRKVFEGSEGHDRALWKQIAEMGWLGTAIPEDYGGLGLGYLELCVIAEELGRALAPVPFSSTVYLFGEAVLAAGSEEQKQKYLPEACSRRTHRHIRARRRRRRSDAEIDPRHAARAASYRARRSP